jgi:biopolymer transport protein ExbB
MMQISELKEWIDLATMGVLISMSIISLGFTIERFRYYASIDTSMFQSQKELELSLSNNLTTIASIASNAPYVGLLGTVGGIIVTFFVLGDSGINDTKTIMQGLALALKATALGLLVAIPSQLFYNMLSRKAEVIVVRYEIEHDTTNQV